MTGHSGGGSGGNGCDACVVGCAGGCAGAPIGAALPASPSADDMARGPARRSRPGGVARPLPAAQTTNHMYGLYVMRMCPHEGDTHNAGETRPEGTDEDALLRNRLGWGPAWSQTCPARPNLRASLSPLQQARRPAPRIKNVQVVALAACGFRSVWRSPDHPLSLSVSSRVSLALLLNVCGLALHRTAISQSVHTPARIHPKCEPSREPSPTTLLNLRAS